MFWGLLFGCGPGFGVVEVPELSASLAMGLGVDPWTGQVWTSRIEGDEDLRQELADFLDGVGEEMSAAEQETYVDLVGLNFDRTVVHLTQVDPALMVGVALRAVPLGSRPEVVFTESGPILSSLVGSRRSFEELSSGTTLKADALVSAASGAWVLVDNGGLQSLAPSSLAWTLALDTAVDFRFLSDGRLLGLKDGALWLLQPPERAPDQVVQPQLPAGTLATELRGHSETHALVRTASETGASGVFLVELATGVADSVPAALVNGRFSGDGQWLYTESGEQAVVYSVATQSSSQHEIGDRSKSWLSEDGRYLVFESYDGVGWIDLQTGATRMSAERFLTRVLVSNDRVWNVDGELGYVELRTGAWVPVSAGDCRPTDGAALADGTLALLCGSGDWLYPGDQALVVLDTRSNAVTGTLALE